MAFTKPSLTTSIGLESYVTEIDDNFTEIDNAFAAIEAELPTIIQDDAFRITNLEWVDPFMLAPGGLINPLSFLPAVDAARENMTFTHPEVTSTGDDVIYESRAFFSGKIHKMTGDVTGEPFGLDELVPPASTVRIIVHLESAGAPLCNVRVSQSDDAAADVASYPNDLVLYSFNYKEVLGNYFILDFTRECNVLPDLVGYQTVVDREELITFPIIHELDDPFGGDGVGKRYGVWAPYDCHVTGGYVRAFNHGNGLAQARVKSDYTSGSVDQYDITEEVTIAAADTTYALTPMDGVPANSTRVVPKGEWIYLSIGPTDSTVEGPIDITAAITVKPIYHPVTLFRGDNG